MPSFMAGDRSCGCCPGVLPRSPAGQYFTIYKAQSRPPTGTDPHLAPSARDPECFPMGDPEGLWRGKRRKSRGQSTCPGPYQGAWNPSALVIQLCPPRTGGKASERRGRAVASPARPTLTWFQHAEVGSGPPGLPTLVLGAGQLGARPGAAGGAEG